MESVRGSIAFDCLSSSTGSRILKEYVFTELSGLRICLASYGEGAGLYTGAVKWTSTNLFKAIF